MNSSGQFIGCEGMCWVELAEEVFLRLTHLGSLFSVTVD